MILCDIKKMDYSDDEVQAMELFEGNYHLWLEWPEALDYCSIMDRFAKVAVIRYYPSCVLFINRFEMSFL